MKKSILKVAAVLLSMVLLCGSVFAAEMPKAYENSGTLTFDDGTGLNVTTVMQNYYGELAVNLDGEEYSLSVILAPDSGKPVFSATVNNPQDFPNGEWTYAVWTPYVYSEESKIFMIRGEEYREEGVAVDSKNVTVNFDEEMAGVCVVDANYITTPEASGYWASNKSWMLILTQADIDTYMSTGKVHSYEWPGLKELLQGNASVETPEDTSNETPVNTPSETANAAPTASKVTVNGEAVSFNAYTINDNNYFKLRDIAKVLSGSGKQFDVTWDGEKNAINLLSDKPYTVAGGELAAGASTEAKAASLNTAAIYLDGELVELTAYTIDGNNYFKLRDLGQTFNFGVAWDGASNTIAIDTSADYTADK